MAVGWYLRFLLSYTMNVWLHKQVIMKIAENGGKVPQELLS